MYANDPFLANGYRQHMYSNFLWILENRWKSDTRNLFYALFIFCLSSAFRILGEKANLTVHSYIYTNGNPFYRIFSLKPLKINFSEQNIPSQPDQMQMRNFTSNNHNDCRLLKNIVQLDSGAFSITTTHSFGCQSGYELYRVNIVTNSLSSHICQPS